MNLRYCSLGDHEVDESDFYVRGKLADGSPRYQTGCKECNREYRRNHYRANKGAYLVKAKKSQQKYNSLVIEWLYEYKEKNPCVDCGEFYRHYQMDFDHLADKTSAIATMISNNSSLEAIQGEMKKCELVCANCHRERTWNKKLPMV